MRRFPGSLLACGACWSAVAMKRSSSMDLHSAEQAYLQGVALEEAAEYENAIKFYEFAARRGHDGAQLNLGNILDDKVEPPRPAEARKWYKLAVAKDYSPAAWNLALHYKKYGQKALYERWLRKAALMGDEDAIEALEGDPNVQS